MVFATYVEFKGIINFTFMLNYAIIYLDSFEELYLTIITLYKMIGTILKKNGGYYYGKQLRED